MSQVFQFEALWNGSKWIEPAFVFADNQGRIETIETKLGNNEEVFQHVKGWAIPGFQNAHSHAFQYAMAGLTEYLPKGAESDNFWKWRDAMYRLAAQVDPESMEAIATMVYAEMLKNGYTSVAEFHYLHHDQNCA